MCTLSGHVIANGFVALCARDYWGSVDDYDDYDDDDDDDAFCTGNMEGVVAVVE